MARTYPELEDSHRSFIQAQPIFFTATAPHQGRINLSPKGMDSFRIFSSRQVGYLDLTGSGNETAAHLRENGRFTIMFCSFTADPLILRLYGRGRVIRPSGRRMGRLARRISLTSGRTSDHRDGYRFGANFMRLCGAPDELRRRTGHPRALGGKERPRRPA